MVGAPGFPASVFRTTKNKVSSAPRETVRVPAQRGDSGVGKAVLSVQLDNRPASVDSSMHESQDHADSVCLQPDTGVERWFGRW